MATAIGTYATTAAGKTRLGITDSTDDTLIGTLCDQINGFIEWYTGRVIAPVASAVYTFDGYSDAVIHGGKALFVKAGLRAVSLLRIADSTGDSWNTVASTDYYLRPTSQEREPGWPATELWLSDEPAGNYTHYPSGFANIEVTATTGWAAIPDEITQVALTLLVRAWHARMAGQADIIGPDEFGKPLVSRLLSFQDRNVLSGYTGKRRFVF